MIMCALGIRKLVFITALIASQYSYANDTEVVQKAIEFLKEACVTSGSALELKASGDGSLKVRSILGSGVKGSITLTKKELEGFADAASELSAQQASEMRDCMKPYIDKILSVMLTGNAAIEPKKIVIETTGNYFITHEFDMVMAYVSSSPNENWTIGEVTDAIGIHPAKVKSYFNVATENGLGMYHRIYNTFRLSDNGLNYVLAKDLIN